MKHAEVIQGLSVFRGREYIDAKSTKDEWARLRGSRSEEYECLLTFLELENSGFSLSIIEYRESCFLMLPPEVALHFFAPLAKVCLNEMAESHLTDAAYGLCQTILFSLTFDNFIVPLMTPEEKTSASAFLRFAAPFVLFSADDFKQAEINLSSQD